jgi:peptidoglycan pentaglycine glycine transferase (the first glycine)
VGATQAAALILQRSMSLLGITFQVLYCPKGPTLDWQNASLVERVLNNLEKFATDQSAIFIKVDPDVPLGWGIPGEEDAKEFPEGHTLQTDLRARKWHFSNSAIRF